MWVVFFVFLFQKYPTKYPNSSPESTPIKNGYQIAVGGYRQSMTGEICDNYRRNGG